MQRSFRLAVLVLLVIAGLILGQYLLANYDLKPQAVRGYLLSFGPSAPLVYMVVYTVRPLIFFPASILSIAGGLVFGPLFGTVYTVIGASLGAFLSFGIARLLGRDFVKPLLKGKLQQCDAFAERNSFSVVLFMRLLPIFPFDMVNYGAGLCGVKPVSYVVATVLGIIPSHGAKVYCSGCDSIHRSRAWSSPRPALSCEAEGTPKRERWCGVSLREKYEVHLPSGRLSGRAAYRSSPRARRWAVPALLFFP
ncbi:MAG: TVP38/TMEM64 family protein [Deltaproteobacteria bacterium]|nr:TVP38/TMEM64 family protein [Deltaproteobacteria bacterium]